MKPSMPQPQLSVRSARAKALAHRLAKQERRSVSQVVESALEHYAKAEPQSKPEPESAHDFWARIIRENHVDGDPDIDLDAIIRENRKPHQPVEF
jgi:hypothetical protein